MFDLVDDLIDALDTVSNDHSKNVKEELDTSVDILDEITSLLHEDHGVNSGTVSTLPSLDLVAAEDVLAPHAETEDDDDSNPVRRLLQERNDTEDDILVVAASNRIKRDKQKQKCHSLLNISWVKTKCRQVGIISQGGTKRIKDAREEREELVYACFDEFRKEVQEFNEQRKGKTSDSEFFHHFSVFVDRIEIKYLKGKLGGLTSDEKARTKVVRLIEAFIIRCRKNEAVDLGKLCNILFTAAPTKEKKVLCKFKYWTCKTCGKKDLLFDETKCSVCGRPKRRAPLPTSLVTNQRMKDPVTEEEEFLAGKEVYNISETGNDSPEARVRRQYLYRKVDYDLDTRTGLKDEVELVLSSVKATIGSDG